MYPGGHATRQPAGSITPPAGVGAELCTPWGHATRHSAGQAVSPAGRLAGSPPCGAGGLVGGVLGADAELCTPWGHATRQPDAAWHVRAPWVTTYVPRESMQLVNRPGSPSLRRGVGAELCIPPGGSQPGRRPGRCRAGMRPDRSRSHLYPLPPRPGRVRIHRPAMMHRATKKPAPERAANTGLT